MFETKDYEIITADLYNKSYKPPRQYIHVQPFAVDRDLPDYNLDDEDAEFLDQKLNREKNFEVTEIVFEGMIDTLEKNSGHSVISAREAKQLLKEAVVFPHKFPHLFKVSALWLWLYHYHRLLHSMLCLLALTNLFVM